MNFQKGLSLRITNICNHNCLFCSQKKFLNTINNTTFLKYDNIILNRILNILKRELYDFLIISGGEPTLNKDVVNLINFFDNHGYKIFLMTNGSNIHNLDIKNMSKNIYIYVSYHSFQDTYELMINKMDRSQEINKKEESEFEKVSKNIELLLGEGHNIVLKLVVTKYNISSLELFVEYIFLRFGNKVGVEVTLMEGLIDTNIRSIACNITEYNNLIEKIYKKYGDKVTFEGGKLCDRDLFIKKNGSLFTSLSNKILGEIKIREDNEIIYQEKKELIGKLNIKRYLKKCKSCNFSCICHGYDIFYLKK